MTTSSITSSPITTNPRTPEQENHYSKLIDEISDFALTEVNPDREALQCLFSRGGEFKAYVVAGVRRFSVKLLDYRSARTILGHDFISPEEIAKSRRLTYTEEQLDSFCNSLPSEEDLVWCRDNDMVLIPGSEKPTSLLDVRALRSGYFYSKEGGWFSGTSENFSRNDKIEPCWFAFRKTLVPDSLSKTWPDQQVLVKAPAFVPNASEATWAITGYKAVRGISLFPNLYGRTSSRDSDGCVVCVGYFDGEGLGVYGCRPDRRDGNLGVLSARKWALKS